MYEETTIAAIATPPGEGSVAIVRISGMDAEKIRKVELEQAQIMQQFSSHLAGEVADGFHPKRCVGLPFDIQPMPIAAPKQSIGSAYARR